MDLLLSAQPNPVPDLATAIALLARLPAHDLMKARELIPSTDNSDSWCIFTIPLRVAA